MQVIGGIIVTLTDDLIGLLKEKVVLLVIDESGLPIFQYPLFFMDDAKKQEDSLLLSSLLTAITSFGESVIGDDVKHVRFGSMFLSFSRDRSNLLYVYLFKNVPRDEMLLQQLHLETMALFARQVKPMLDRKKGHDYLELDANEQSLVQSIFNPFLKSWLKKLNVN